jgi:hypothetical protein
MRKTFCKDKQMNRDVDVTIHNHVRTDRIIETIEIIALKQVQMTKEMLEVFNELKTYDFFVPYLKITGPHIGSATTDGWEINVNYSNMTKIFSEIGQDAPYWMKDIAKSINESVSSNFTQSHFERFEFYLKKWSYLVVESIHTNSTYHLNKAIHDEVTTLGTKPIVGYNAPLPLEILEKYLPEKYKTDKKAS